MIQYKINDDKSTIFKYLINILIILKALWRKLSWSFLYFC